MQTLKTVLLIACALFAITTFSQESMAFNWTPEFHMKFKGVSGVDIAPGGAYVAYVVRTPIMEGEQSEYNSQIWVASSDGKMNFQYTRGEKSSTSPAFSPDGHNLAFLSSRQKNNQIWLMRILGGEAEQITEMEKSVNNFQWSPDGTKIAFLMSDLDSEEEEERKKEKRDVIAVDQNFKYAHIYTVGITPDDSGKRAVQRITAGDFHVMSYDWAPDGAEIVFSHKSDPRINTSRQGADISKVSSDSGAIVPLVRTGGVEGSPIFSPDGRRITYTSTGEQPEPIGMRDIYIMDADGGNSIKLGHTPDRNASLLGWSADGNEVLFTEALGVSRAILSISARDANQEVKTLTPLDGTLGSADYDPASGQLAYTYQTPDWPAEVFVQETNGMPKKVSAVNSGIELPNMGKTEVIRWKSYDGLEIEGLLTYPVNYQPGQKVPLILQIHGGPAGVFTKTFTGNPSIYMTQYFAEQGYAVLKPNPRGSSGYGKEFRYANFKDWGYGDYEDLMSGVDKTIEMGLADEDKLTAMGWSYGGYMTSFLVTRTDRFKAASMGAGLPNMVSMVTTTDIPDYIVGHFGGEFWDDYETYEKHSAMYRIKHVVTPTQVIHGANDLRVPFTQGQEFYVALQRRGVPTEMLVLPRTPHGPREPKLLMEVSPRILGWFKKYLEIRP